MHKVTLRVCTGKHAGTLLELPLGRCDVGRDESCRLRLNTSFVSRRHCEFVVSEQEALLRDLGSTNGTIVNRYPIQQIVRLAHGDKIAFGDLEFEVIIETVEMAPQGDPMLSDTRVDAQSETRDFRMPDGVPAPETAPEIPNAQQSTMVTPAPLLPPAAAPQEQPTPPVQPPPAQPAPAAVPGQTPVAAPPALPATATAPPPPPAPPTIQTIPMAPEPDVPGAPGEPAAEAPPKSGGVPIPPLQLPDPKSTGLQDVPKDGRKRRFAPVKDEEKIADRAAEVLRKYVDNEREKDG